MKKKLIIIGFIIFLLVFSFNLTILAEDLEHQFDFSVGSGAGSTEFSFGDIETNNLNYGSKRSLDFPLAVEMINLSYENDFRIPTLNIGGISIELEKNLNDDAGTLTDTEWLAATGINNKDVIGSSAVEVKEITRWNFKLRNDWLQAAENMEYTLHLGYKQDRYDLLSNGLEQSYLTDAGDEPAGTTTTAAGDNSNYEAKYDIPYIGFDLRKESNKDFNWLFTAAYSNWVEMEDEYNYLNQDLSTLL